ncbi:MULTISPECIES: response regulator [unclassified Leptolyngbya]|uniref:response regulator n=1 Tax=unclassified Leptolyngbya TaxID=2650499 RepID=UPI00168706D6|nr:MULTISPECIES: response regulator [unclassified Leptolyngbya]MBD1909422.1 response regulator [Leptolyngbya sp. FACHB-8]MBD2158586.1 response regulator [Leptolyngbya sp. FACHB-16]
MINTTRLNVEELVRQFQLNIHEHFTGELQVQSNASLTSSLTGHNTWSLYFLFGRLLWANSNGHRFRRWRRAFLYHNPNLYSDALLPDEPDADPFWEYRVITSLVRSEKLQREQAIALLEYLLGEVLFDVLQSGASYHQEGNSADIKRIGEPIAVFSPKQLFSNSYKRWQSWCKAELADYSPHLAPYIDNVQELQNCIPAKAYDTLSHLIDGESPLADIAVETKQDVLRFTKLLNPLVRKGLMTLRQVPDLLPSSPINSTSLSSKEQNLPKILCIDDSPVICWQLEQVLTKLGYPCISIQDSLQAIPTLLEEKPSLVFLDLVMPIASGYEICSQIRRISAFKDIPVIILTGNDGIVDRVRAKVVGASDFMSKPVNPQRLMEVVRRYCPISTDEMPSLTECLRS